MSNYHVYVRPHGQLARLFLWALPVDVLIGVVGWLVWRALS